MTLPREKQKKKHDSRLSGALVGPVQSNRRVRLSRFFVKKEKHYNKTQVHMQSFPKNLFANHIIFQLNLRYYDQLKNNL